MKRTNMFLLVTACLLLAVMIGGICVASGVLLLCQVFDYGSSIGEMSMSVAGVVVHTWYGWFDTAGYGIGFLLSGLACITGSYNVWRIVWFSVKENL